MIIRQKIIAVKTTDFEIRFENKPLTHTREILTFDNRQDAFAYQKQHSPNYGNGVAWNKNGDSYITREIWELPSWIAKAKIRLNYSQENNVYTLCACCGRDLHENNANSHTKTKYGIVGAECIRKLLDAGLDL